MILKMLNDTYGHDAGDMALVCIANIMRQSADYKKLSAGEAKNS